MRLVWLHGLVWCITSAVASAHPFHETLAQFELNDQNQSLELALRIDAIDLEQMVERWLGERINIETDERAERSIELWLRERLAATLENGSKAKLNWIGYEFEGAFAWLYLELETPADTSWVDLAHTVLFDWHPQPTNHLVGVGQSKGQSYATTIERPVARIRLLPEPSRAWWWALADLAVLVWNALQEGI